MDEEDINIMETTVSINSEPNNSNTTFESNEQKQQQSSPTPHEKKVFECRNNCDAKFDSFKLLNRHIYTEHRDVVEKKVAQCKYCGERTPKKLMIRHLQKEHSQCKVEGCDERLPIYARKAHMLREHGNDYVNNLKETAKKKWKQIIRKCPVTDCDREFKKKTDLKNHMKKNHTQEENSRQCKHEGCNEVHTPWAMKQHVWKEHKPKFDKECQICKFVCTSKPAWKNHRKKHVKEYFHQKDETLNTNENAENMDESDDSLDGDIENDNEESSDDDEPIEKKKRSVV